MDLPSLLNVAIGLIFIYLILSLLAAEIQETLATLFQWRGKHLKEAIFNLLIGDNLYRKPSKDQKELLKKENEKAEQLVEKVYENPLILDINQEARKGVPVLMRQLIWGIEDGLYQLFRQGIDGKKVRNMPSYIPSKIFSIALMDKMKISDLAKNRGAIYLSRLIDTNIIEDVETLVKDKFKDPSNKEIHDVLLEELGRFRDESNNICGRLALGKASLDNAIERLKDAFDEYQKVIEYPKKDIQDDKQTEDIDFKNSSLKKELQKDLKGIQREVFGICDSIDDASTYENRMVAEARVMAKFRPTLAQILELFDTNTEIHSEIAAILHYEEIAEQRQRNSETPKDFTESNLADDKNSIKKEIESLVRVKDGNPPLYRVKKDTPLYGAYIGIRDSVESVKKSLPTELRPSLVALVRNAQIEANSVQDELKLLQQEIAQWFDSSMERATGVYKRNAKGVAFLIGLVLAISLNTDSLYIANRLSHDPLLTKAIADNASILYAKALNQKATPDNQTQKSQTPLENFRENAQEVLYVEPLPIGWTNENLRQQLKWSITDKRPFPIISLINCLPGWLLTGLAISMGAPFWFELLGKIVNVRNTGAKPKSSVESED
jgi:hypothetical protein